MGDRFSGFAQFLAELRRRRVFRVAAVYAVAGWVVIQASSAILPTLEAPLWVGKVVLVLVALGFVLALALAWAFDVTPSGIVRTSDAEARRTSGGEEVAAPADRAMVPPGAALPQPSRRRARALALLGAGVILTVAAVGSYAAFFRSDAARHGATLSSVAVLAFTDLSPNHAFWVRAVGNALSGVPPAPLRPPLPAPAATDGTRHDSPLTT